MQLQLLLPLLLLLFPSSTLAQTALERQALVDLYHQAGGKHWRNSNNWMSSTTICDWYGVTCSNSTTAAKPRRIIQFSLYDNLLQGTVPASLSALTEVNYFALSTNKLEGTIPMNLGSTFVHCQYFDLRYNFLNGTLPIGFKNMKNLTHLILANNDFTDHGNLPKIVQGMTKLQYIDVRSNYLTGPAPSSLCQLNNVTFCGLVDVKYHTNNFAKPDVCLKKICEV